MPGPGLFTKTIDAPTIGIARSDHRVNVVFARVPNGCRTETQCQLQRRYVRVRDLRAAGKRFEKITNVHQELAGCRVRSMNSSLTDEQPGETSSLKAIVLYATSFGWISLTWLVVCGM